MSKSIKSYMKKLSLLSLLILLISCNSSHPQYVVIEGAMLGTTLRVVADIDASPRELYSAAMELDRSIKAEMSIFDEESLLSRINRGETDSLTPAIAYNIALSDSVSRISDGAYDVTVKPLVSALGFGGDGAQEHINIDSLLEFVGYDKISVEGGRLLRQDSRTQLDFNSIAKGYTVDRLAQTVEQMGAENYLVDIGGEISTRGVNSQGGAWRIGIESPFDGNMSSGEFIEKRIAIPSDSPYRAMATSGNYRRFYLDRDGNKIAHTIDPRTGRSKVSTLLSATVIAPNCALADAYGTMFMAVGSEGAISLSEKLVDAEVYFIFADSEGGYREYLSEGMAAMIME